MYAQSIHTHTGLGSGLYLGFSVFVCAAFSVVAFQPYHSPLCAGAQHCHFLDDLMAITNQIVKYFPFQRDAQYIS